MNETRQYIRVTAQRRLGKPSPAPRALLRTVHDADATCLHDTVEATGNPWVRMLWACEEQTGLPRLLFRHGVLVRNWPWGIPFEAPGYIGSLRRLQRIAEGLRRGFIWFEVLTPAEVMRIERALGLSHVESRRSRRDADVVRFMRPLGTRSRRLRKGTINKTNEIVRPEDEIFSDDDIEEWTDEEVVAAASGAESEIEEFDD